MAIKKNPNLVWYPEPRFDTVVFPAGALTTAAYFSVALNGQLAGAAAGTNKTVADTNLKNSAMIGNPNEFELHGFAVEPNILPTAAGATEALDWALIYNTGVFTFQMGGAKDLLEIPLMRIPVAGGPIGVGNTAAGGATLVNGASFSSNYYKFHQLNPLTDEKEQLLLKGDTNFSVVITYPNAAITLTVAHRVRVYLIGYYGSSVQ